MTTRPSKLVCIGRNYRAHAAELGNDVPTEPLIFLKPPSSLISDGDAIRLPTLSAQVEYEGEIAVIMGGRASHVTERDAPRLVRSIAAFNDVTARDLQRKDSQWTRAKGFDTFAPLGAEFAQSSEWDGLTVVTRVNGVERQRARADLMVFAIPMLIAFISSIMTLEPGDVIATGTPAGVGRLTPGDNVEVEIQGPDTRILSRVGNPVVAGE